MQNGASAQFESGYSRNGHGIVNAAKADRQLITDPASSEQVNKNAHSRLPYEFVFIDVCSWLNIDSPFTRLPALPIFEISDAEQ